MGKARKAQHRLRRLTGNMGLVPENVRRTQVACVQAVALYGSELWWKGEGEKGTIGRASDIQSLTNQQARAITGCFKSTNAGQLVLMSGLRPAHSLLNNRGRRYALRMATLPEGDQARELLGAPSELGTRLTTWLGTTGRRESTILHQEVPLEADCIIHDREAAKTDAVRPRPGLTMWTDGSRLDSGACGYSVVWDHSPNGWRGVKTHMGYN
jgi:hypothetical protein